jgi:hypothetical protein
MRNYIPRAIEARWFEICVVCPDGPAEGARQLARAARAEGHLARLFLEGEELPFVAIGILAEQPRLEINRLMLRAGLSGDPRPSPGPHFWLGSA